MSSTLGASLLRTVLSDGTLKILGSGLDKGPIIKCLESYAVRVQKSAFEGRLTKKQYERLITKSVQIIDENTDSLRMYILDDVLDCYSWGVKADTDGTCVIV